MRSRRTVAKARWALVSEWVAYFDEEGVEGLVGVGEGEEGGSREEVEVGEGDGVEGLSGEGEQVFIRVVGVAELLKISEFAAVGAGEQQVAQGFGLSSSGGGVCVESGDDGVKYLRLG